MLAIILESALVENAVQWAEGPGKVKPSKGAIPGGLPTPDVVGGL